MSEVLKKSQTSGVECAELRMCPNEFESGPERNGQLIANFEKEGMPVAP